MIRTIVLGCLLFGLSPVVRAATVTVICGGVVSTTDSCSGNAVPPPGFTGPGIAYSASESGSGDQYQVSTLFGGSYNPGIVASASVSGILSVIVSGGTGTAWLLPCLAAASEHGDAFAVFGPISSGNGNSCLQHFQGIPITFGTPLVDSFSLYAQAGGFVGEDGQALFNGFEVLDATGSVIPSAVVTVTDVTTPEPATVILCLVSIGVVVLCRLRPNAPV